MATVYLAERASLDIRKLVVLKVLNVDLAAHEEMRSAFRREAHLSARMNHPNVVQVFEVAEHGGHAIIVMEYLDGMPLSRVVRQSALPLNLHLDILTQALDGLHHFHELTDEDGTPLNPVHRDVSPQNILVLHDGGAKVLDFGIAKLKTGDEEQTRTGLIKGKIHYMPPEQLTGSAVDRRSDIFAMGVMLWEALAGRRLWEGRKDLDVMKGLTRGNIPSLRAAAPDVAPELEAIVNRALQPDPDHRFATARDMQVALEKAIRQTVGPAHSRDIAAFMREQFAEARKEQRMRLEAVRREGAGGSFETQSGLSWVPTPWRSGEAAPAAQPSTPEPAAAPPVAVRRRSMPFRLAWAAVALGAVGLAFMAYQSRSKAPTVVARPMKSVQFNVLVDPPDAEIILGGKLLGIGRYQGEQADTGREQRLEIRAAGRISKQEAIRFNADVTRLFRLEALPPGAVSSVETKPRSANATAKANVAGSHATSPPSVQGRATPSPETASARLAAASPAPNSAASAKDALASAPTPSGSVASNAAPIANSTAATAPTTVPAPAVSAARTRQVAPKVAQGLLEVNVAADPYRVRPPAALQKMAGVLDTMVRICVNTSGGVSSVSVLKSADPGLDRQITATVPRWRYRPLLDEGVAVPFCYTTRMRFVGG